VFPFENTLRFEKRSPKKNQSNITERSKILEELTREDEIPKEETIDFLELSFLKGDDCDRLKCKTKQQKLN